MYNSIKADRCTFKCLSSLITKNYSNSVTAETTKKINNKPNDESVITDECLLSAANRERTLHCMQSSPPIGLQKTTSTRESIFAAVLIALCTKNNPANGTKEVSILYTRRSMTLSRHKRQISFPGGIKDSTDRDYIDCALRETEEEIGLPRNRIEIWGAGKLVTPPRTAAIMPIIGVVHDFDMSELKLNKQEVEEAFTLPVAKLAQPNTLRHTQFKTGYSAPAFIVDQYKVWGVTGFITHSFLNCLLPPELNVLKGRVKYIRPYKKQL